MGCAILCSHATLIQQQAFSLDGTGHDRRRRDDRTGCDRARPIGFWKPVCLATERVMRLNGNHPDVEIQELSLDMDVFLPGFAFQVAFRSAGRPCVRGWLGGPR